LKGASPSPSRNERKDNTSSLLSGMGPPAKHRKHRKKEKNMEKSTCTSRIIRSALALTLALVIWSPLQVQSASHMAGEATTKPKMMDRCQEMMAQKQQMMADMKAQDAELTAQLAIMNSAPQEQKLDLLAAVVTRMLEQRIAMEERKTKMHEEMMQHMMQHMPMDKDAMAKCPMMKGMDEKSGDAHKHQ
jgi:hypothetical protein